MTKDIIKIENENWYKGLIEDCETIMVEGVFRSRMALIEAYHKFGKRILEDNTNFTKAGYTIDGMLQRVATSLGKSQRTVRSAIQFARKYPDLEAWINTLPEGKNLSWHKIVNNYLTESKAPLIELPKGKYQVIYADPPWPYPEREDAKNLYGNTKYHYESMSIKEIRELKVGELASENSVLFLWVATNFLEESFNVINDWGFNYKSQMVWIKEGGQGGIGWYFWGDHELLLVATKGSFLPKKIFSSVLKAPRQEHSQKPNEVYEIIEGMYPNTKKIELFLRGKPRKNWVGWGDEAEL